MKNTYLVLKGYTGDFLVLVFQAISIYLFVNNNPNYLYASWVLVLTFVNPIVGFSNMSMDSVIATEENDKQVKSFLLFRLRNLFLFFPVVLTINFLYESNASPWFLLTLAYLLKSFEGFVISFRGLYYRDKSISKVNLSKIFSKFGYVLGFGYFLQEIESLSFTLLVIIGWNFLVFLFYDIFYLKNTEYLSLKSIFDLKTHFQINQKFFLLGFNSFLQLIVISLPQILIERFIDLEILSFIGIVMLFNSALDTVYLSSINSLRKSYSELVQEPDLLTKFIRKIILFFFTYLVALIVFFNIFGDFLFKFYNQNLSSQIDVMTLVLIGSFLFYTANVINFRYFVNRQVVQILKLFFIRALVAVCISYMFVIQYKAIGFGAVYLISNIFYLIFSLLKNKVGKTGEQV